MRICALSLAHSSRARGARNASIKLDEYSVSERATLAASSVLRGAGIPLALIDAADTNAKHYANFKVEAINKLNPTVAVEIHCNASEDQDAQYGEVIHHPVSTVGEAAARAVSNRLRDTLGYSRHSWPWHGHREWSPARDKHQFFFLSRTNCPSIIVEGLFISNDEQALWLKSEGGAETYGLMVGEGLVDFFKTEGF